VTLPKTETAVTISAGSKIATYAVEQIKTDLSFGDAFYTTVAIYLERSGTRFRYHEGSGHGSEATYWPSTWTRRGENPAILPGGEGPDCEL